MNMKYGLLLLFGVLFASANAQDVIIKRNGDEIESKISKVSENEIEYRKWTNLEEPLYTLKTSQIFMIKYKNGEKDVFDISSNIESTTGKIAENEYIKTSPSSNNSALINQYNKKVIYDKKGKSKSTWGLCIFNVSQTSILNDENIEISFFRGGKNILSSFTIVLKNLTDKTILLDLGSSFKLFSDGTFSTFHDNTITTTSSGSSNDIGLNLGSVASVLGIGGALGTLASGVTVGGSSGKTKSTTQVKERIISIPPHGVYKVGDGEIFIGLNKVLPQLKKGEEFDFTEENTPLGKEYIFTYSTDSRFSSYSIVKFKMFVKQVFGLSSSNFEGHVHPQTETSLWHCYYAK